MSSAAALSVAPESFAAATGLNVAARQVGGALGVAALAVLLVQKAGGDSTAPFAHVYLFGAVMSFAAAAVATRLVLASPAATGSASGPEASAGAPVRGRASVARSA